MRTLAFFPFASAYWALLPLVARSQMDQAAASFTGCLLGALGVGAIGGSLRAQLAEGGLGPDRVVALGDAGHRDRFGAVRPRA